MVQGEAQYFHWSNSTATIHPFVFYHKDDIESVLKNDNFVLISEYNAYDTVAVHFSEVFETFSL